MTGVRARFLTGAGSFAVSGPGSRHAEHALRRFAIPVDENVAGSVIDGVTLTVTTDGGETTEHLDLSHVTRIQRQEQAA